MKEEETSTSDDDLPEDGIADTREQAEELGLKKFHGKTCYQCRTEDGDPQTRAVRYASNGSCVECAKRKARARYQRQKRIKAGLDPEPPKKQGEGDFIDPLTDFETFVMWEGFTYALRTSFLLSTGIITRAEFESMRYTPRDGAWEAWKSLNSDGEEEDTAAPAPAEAPAGPPTPVSATN